MKELMVEGIESVFNEMYVESIVESIEKELKIEYGCVESIYSNLYLFELFVEYLNEGSLSNIEKISEYWLRKSLNYLKKFGFEFKEIEELLK